MKPLKVMMFKIAPAFMALLMSMANPLTGPVFAQDNETSYPEQQMSDFSLSGTSAKGKQKWDITGESADIESDVIKLNRIESNLYQGTESVKLTAEKGNFDRQEGQVHLEKDVVITTSSGAKLTTDSLDWDRKNEMVSTKAPVNIERQDMTITGQGAKGYPDLNKVDLEKDVHVKIENALNETEGELKEKNKIIIECDGPLQVDYKKNTAVFNNNVKVQTPDALIESDIMEVYFHTQDTEKVKDDADSAELASSRIEKIVARGNVKITRDENMSYSEEAVYAASDRRITLSGRPKLVIYSTEGFNASFGN
jgi:LPS export ABC transporter protein LptC